MVKLEKIEYKAIPVRDLLVEIKNLSELMIDLAYSAVLFDSRELAEEVLELEESVDTLAYILDMNVMIAARDAQEDQSTQNYLIRIDLSKNSLDLSSRAVQKRRFSRLIQVETVHQAIEYVISIKREI